MKNKLRRRQERHRRREARRHQAPPRAAQRPLEKPFRVTFSRPISAEYPDDWLWCAWCHRFFQQKHVRTDYFGDHEGCPFCERAGFYAAIYPWQLSGWTSEKKLRVGLRSDGPPESRLPDPKIVPQIHETPERIARIDEIQAMARVDPEEARRMLVEFQAEPHPHAEAIHRAQTAPQVLN